MFFVYKFCIVVCYITYARYLILCYMKAIYLHLHNKPPFVYFVFYSLVKAIYNEANERCKPLCYTAIRRVPRSAYSHGPKTPTPPLCRYIREHPSSPEFF